MDARPLVEVVKKTPLTKEKKNGTTPGSYETDTSWRPSFIWTHSTKCFFFFLYFSYFRLFAIKTSSLKAIPIQNAGRDKGPPPKKKCPGAIVEPKESLFFIFFCHFLICNAFERRFLCVSLRWPPPPPALDISTSAFCGPPERRKRLSTQRTKKTGRTRQKKIIMKMIYPKKTEENTINGLSVYLHSIRFSGSDYYFNIFKSFRAYNKV